MRAAPSRAPRGGPAPSRGRRRPQAQAKAMSTTTCQVVGFLLSVLGLAGCIAATGMDTWSTQDLYDNPVTSVFQYEGLWQSCVRQSSGFTECRPYFTILGLPGRRGPPLGPPAGSGARGCCSRWGRGTPRQGGLGGTRAASAPTKGVNLRSWPRVKDSHS